MRVSRPFSGKARKVTARKRQEIFDWLNATGHPYAKVIEKTKKDG